MESYCKLDATRCASIARALILVTALSISFVAQSQTSDDLLPRLKAFQDRQQWHEVVDAAAKSSTRSAEIDYIYGIALAKLDRLEEARDAFLAGEKLAVTDSRFPAELAGIAFKRKQRPEALHWLLRAHKLAPDDSYINDFLGTVYFLEGNLEACLKYWNRAGKPLIENVRTDPELRVDPVILDRTLAFAPGSKLKRSDWLTSEVRLRGLGIFPRYGFRLDARNDDKFGAVLQAKELNGFGTNKWTALLYTFRGVIFETITPEYYNLNGSATNLTSLYRWDKNKRRVAGALSGPLHRDPKWRYRVAFDLRNENWAVRNFSDVPTTSLGDLNFRRETGTVEVASFRNGRWNWSTGGEISNRDFRSVATDPGLPSELFLGGNQLKHFARLNFDLLRIPEHRFTIASTLSSQEGRTWNAANSAFAKLQVGSRVHWFPQLSGDDYEMTGQVRYGRTYGDVPFDELFMLGIERDNDLMMRGHVGTDDGKKGFAPLGRNYFLSNWEIDKNIYGNGLFRLTLGPFVDTGKITDPSEALGTKKWLVDAGAQLKVRALGVRFALTYGKDLRTGRNAYYVYVTE